MTAHKYNSITQNENTQKVNNNYLDNSGYFFKK